MYRYLVGSIYGRSSIKIAILKCEKLTDGQTTNQVMAIAKNTGKYLLIRSTKNYNEIFKEHKGPTYSILS
jgi:hypothetical protein